MRPALKEYYVQIKILCYNHSTLAEINFWRLFVFAISSINLGEKKELINFVCNHRQCHLLLGKTDGRKLFLFDKDGVLREIPQEPLQMKWNCPNTKFNHLVSWHRKSN